MTHIIELDQDEFVKTCEDFCVLILKPVRTIGAGDKIIFEHNTEQQERTVSSITDRPGLMKGHGLYIFNQLT